MTLVLVGLMGAGKTTVGAMAAKELGWEFLDVDVAIAARTGKTVRQIWESDGESGYRQLESDAVLDALHGQSATVIAAPGGVVMDPQFRASLDAACVIWLRVDPVTLAGRVAPGDHRPLLGDDPLSVLTIMAAERADLYAEVADAVIDADGLDPLTVVGHVLDLLHQHETHT